MRKYKRTEVFDARSYAEVVNHIKNIGQKSDVHFGNVTISVHGDGEINVHSQRVECAWGPHPPCTTEFGPGHYILFKNAEFVGVVREDVLERDFVHIRYCVHPGCQNLASLTTIYEGEEEIQEDYCRTHIGQHLASDASTRVFPIRENGTDDSQ